MPSAGATSGSLTDNDDNSSYGNQQPGLSYACTAGVCYFFQLTWYSSSVRKTFAPETNLFTGNSVLNIFIDLTKPRLKTANLDTFPIVVD